MSQDIFYSPPASRGKPSYQALADRAARQKARIQFLQAQTQLAGEAMENPPALSSSSTGSSSSTSFSPLPSSLPAASSASTQIQDVEEEQHSRRNRTYSLSFKLHVVAYASTHSIRATALHFGIDQKVIRYWKSNQAEFQLQTRPTTRFRISRTQVGHYSDMENELFDWVIDQRDRGFCITQGMIRCEALRILNGTNFEASNGWLTRFLRRKRLVIRRITTSGRDLPQDAGVQVNNFLGECQEFVEMDFDRDTLLNGDETSIYLDPPTRQTYAEKGSRRVEAITSGQQKTRISVCFTATASGTKLKPLILIPIKNRLKNWVPPNNVELVYGTNGNFNEIVICEHYIPKILVNYKNQRRYQGLHLVFDQAPCHTTQKAKSTFTSASVNVK